jgi:hypothetical protein
LPKISAHSATIATAVCASVTSSGVVVSPAPPRIAPKNWVAISPKHSRNESRS